MKLKSTTLILAWFLGGFGMHHYYLGNTGRGILYTLFFRTLIPALVAFIEFIIIACMSKEEFDEKYNSGFTK